MPTAKSTYLFILTQLFIVPLFAGEPYTLDKIVVKAQNPSDESQAQYISAPLDALDYASGIEIRKRGTHGVQGDLSLRGSTFEQVAVLIDGVKVMDPQTGHHNLDIPLTRFDIEDIDLVKQGASSSSGAGGLAGSANFILKKPLKKSFNLDTLFGMHALRGQTISLSYPKDDFFTRLSFDHTQAKAARANTDFDHKTVSLYAGKDQGASSCDMLFGYQKKDFGADSFYSNLYPEEEEHTETLFSKLHSLTSLSLGSWKNDLFFRRHKDKFILRRNNPTSVNYHTTYVYGFFSQLSIPVKCGQLHMGAGSGRDEINSTNLGKRSRYYEAGSLGFSRAGNKIDLNIEARLDYYQKWSLQESFSAGFGYKLILDALSLRSSISRAFRIPSFTELYYSDPANRGNAQLRTEKADTYRLGLGYNNKGFLSAGLDGFFRRGRNLIDWTRRSGLDPWVATNLGKVDFRGVETNMQLKLDSGPFEKATVSYTYTDAHKKQSGFFSKYALDILKHQYLLSLHARIISLSCRWELSYNERYFGEVYFVGNLYISKRMQFKDLAMEPFVGVDNFSNTKYTEVAGVLQPNRWIKGGLRLEW